ncbi:MAG: hypothetical protein ACPGYV_11460, partial [Phycisphaeraceae bacterium]
MPSKCTPPIQNRQDAAAKPQAASDPPLSSDTRVDALYLHLPFCFHKCHYCDFFSVVEPEGQAAPRQRAFTDALIAELETGQYRHARLNYANGDMVGHTGHLQASVMA